MENKKNIVLAVTGASGSIYAYRLMQRLQELKNQTGNVALVFSKNAGEIWKYELGEESWKSFGFQQFESSDFHAPFASGSCDYGCMIICPASMGTIGRIAHGASDDLICRAADVMLKERRNLIIVPRETPYNLIHLRNMTTLTEAGATICPANPSFYTKPTSLNELADTVINRVLELAGLESGGKRWGDI